MMDNHLDRKLDLIAEMLRCVYFSLPNNNYEIKFKSCVDEYTTIMSELELKQLGLNKK